MKCLTCVTPGRKIEHFLSESANKNEYKSVFPKDTVPYGSFRISGQSRNRGNTLAIRLPCNTIMITTQMT